MVDTIPAIMVEALFILAITTREIKQGRLSKYSLYRYVIVDINVIMFLEKYLKKLVGRTEIKDALKAMKGLDNLSQEGARMASVQIAHLFLRHKLTQNEEWETPLHLASREDKAEVARVLLEQHGADVATQNRYWDTPLHLASREDNVEVARVLLEHGTQLIIRNKDGDTPLHLASRNNKVKVARVLLEHDALAFFVTSENLDWDTPLHLASREDNVEVARVLLDHCADVNAQNKDEDTPLHLAS